MGKESFNKRLKRRNGIGAAGTVPAAASALAEVLVLVLVTVDLVLAAAWEGRRKQKGGEQIARRARGTVDIPF
jgi:hypothetical protein